MNRIFCAVAFAAALSARCADAETRDLSSAHRGIAETAVEDAAIDAESCAEWVAGALRPCPQAKDLVVARGRQSRTIYGLAFGAAPKAGPRHLRICFKKEIPSGTVFLTGGKVSLSVLKNAADYPGDPSDESQWQPLSCIQGDAKPSREPRRSGSSYWYGPEGLKTRAIRATASPTETDPVDDNGMRKGYLSSLYVFPAQLFNIAAFAAPGATSGARNAARLTDGETENWNMWSVPNGSGASCILSWPEPVAVRVAGFGQPFFESAEIQCCTASPNVHPQDAKEKDWKTVAKVEGLRSGYPFASRMVWIDLGREVKTRGLRVRPLAGPAIGGGFENPEHGHVEHYVERGAKTGLSEFAVLAGRSVFKSARRASMPDATPVGVPVDFEMPFDGLATLVVENAKGDRVRNLVSAGSFKKGPNRVYWDCSDDLARDIDAANHGLYNVPERPVAPGRYFVKGIAHKPLSGRYETSVYNPGSPPWCTPDHKGAWLANHEPPRAACALPPGRAGDSWQIALGANITEGPDGMITVGLDGVKTGGRRWIGGTWTAAAFLACDTGPERIAEHDWYVGGLGRNGDSCELRVTAIKGSGEEKIADVPLGPGQERAHGGIAVWNGLVAASLNCRNEIWFRNLKTGREERMEIDSPRGVAFAPGGTLYALSGSRLVRIDPAAKTASTVAEGFDDPASLAFGGKNVAFVSEHGDANVVKIVRLADGKVVKTIGTPGPVRSGKYDETHMNRPSEMAYDPEGRLWVAEHDYLPKRVSVWDARSGRLKRAFYGPPKYGAGGRADPREPTLFYYTEGGGAMAFRIDPAKGSTTVEKVLFRPDSDRAALDACGYPLWGEFASMPGEAIYSPKGVRLYSNSFNTDPTSGASCAILCREEDGRFVPAAYAVADHSQKRFTLWSDRNSDGRRQADETFEADAETVGFVFQQDLSLDICFWRELPEDAAKKPRALRLKPVAYGPKGNPLYDFARAEIVFEGATWGPSTGGNQMMVDRAGNAFTSNGVKPGPVYSIAGRTAAGAVWSVPNMWPGLHAGHSAPRDAVKGRLVAVTRMLGDFVYPKPGESVVALNGNHGEIYFMTGDGYFIDNFFEDVAVGRRWNFPAAVRGMELAGVAPGDEHFWPTLTQYADGSIHIVANDDSATLVHLRGLETLTRFSAGAVDVSPKTLAAVAKAREAREAARRGRAGSGRAKLRLLSAPPALDGDTGDWPDDSFAVIDSRGVAAYFDSNSKPYDIRGALAATKTHLYAAWRARGAGNIADNAGGSDALLFKTGGGLDIMLETPRGPVRLLSAFVAGAAKSILYEKSAPGASAAERVDFTSPVQSVSFARVRDVSDKVRLARGADGDFELEVPLDLVGISPREGTPVKGDIGVLRGADGATIARLYWSNKATGIVSDVPSEAELKPSNWGVFDPVKE